MENNICLIAKEGVPTLKPSHISLGKCPACHQFMQQYSSINHADIIDLLRTGCKYDGFKRNFSTKSEEEESFSSMHHVLRLSALDDSYTKELCVQKINDYTIVAGHLEKENFVVSGNNSVVIFIYNVDRRLDAYYFDKHYHSVFSIDYNDQNFSANLDANVLFLKFDTYMTIINFRRESPEFRHIQFDVNTSIIATSREMLVTRKLTDSTPLLHCEHLDIPLNKEIAISKETLDGLVSNKNAIFSVYQHTVWLSANEKNIKVYSYSPSTDLCLVKTIEIKSCVQCENSDITFVTFSFSHCSKQAFLLYLQDGYSDDRNSFILVFDLKSLMVVSVLEIELTMNRQPQLKMCPSMDGGTLLVQERFEDRVIFYQVFSLFQTQFTLQNIVISFIRGNFSNDSILNSNLSSHLIDKIMEGL